MKRARFLVVAALAVALGSATSVSAHGPCYCFSPAAGAPGTTIRVPESYGAVEVLWNPDPDRLGNPALVDSPWERHFHPELKTLSLARQEKPGAISFEVPRVPDGKYLVVVFDLGEGGPRNHYTWHTFAVTRASHMPVTGSATSRSATVALGALLFGVLLLLYPGRLSRRRGDAVSR